MRFGFDIGRIDHAALRFSWKRINQDKPVVVEGVDVAIIEDGKIARMVGFFGVLV